MRQRTFWLIALLSILLLTQTASAADSGVLNSVVDKFKDATGQWASTISSYATWLFWTLATISLVWTFGFMALRKADIGEFFAEFIRFCVFTGFYLWLLRNGPEYAMSIVRSMMTIGAKAGGVSELNPSTPVDIAFDVLERSFKSLSIRHPIDSLAIILVSLIILVCLATVAANVLLVLVTAWIMAYAGVFVLGFGGSRWTSDIAIGYFRTVAGIGLKLLTMTLMIGIATSVVNSHLADIKNGAKIDQLLVICVVALVLSMLIHSLPNMVAGLIPGGGGAAGAVGSFSAGSVAQTGMQAARTASSAAGSVISGGMSLAGGMASGLASGVSGGVKSMYSAFSGMQSGASSGMGMASQMASMLGGGGSSSGGASSPLGGAMGLAASASGGMGGDLVASAASSLAPAGAQESGGSSEPVGGSAEGGAGGGGSVGESGGASDGGSGGGSGENSSSGASGSSSSGGARAALAQAAGAEGSGSSASTAGTGTRSNVQTAEINAGSRSAQAKAASGGSASTTSPSAGGRSSLNTASSSRSFDPATEVAAYRDSKQEKA